MTPAADPPVAFLGWWGSLTPDLFQPLRSSSYQDACKWWHRLSSLCRRRL